MTINVFRITAISSILIWLCALALIPFLLIVAASFLSMGQQDRIVQLPLTLNAYQQVFSPIVFRVVERSVLMSATTTVICLILGYPFAYCLTRIPPRLRNVALLLLIIPFWTSSLIRMYALITILKVHGLLNQLLLNIGVINQPLHILYTPLASQIGLVYGLLPFMVLPIYSVLDKLDWQVIEAARDLGASRWQTFWRIIVPLSRSGIFSGILLVFLPAMTLFYIPAILGGARSMLLGNLINNEFLQTQNWPFGSALSVVLTAFMLLLLTIYNRLTAQRERRHLL